MTTATRTREQELDAIAGTIDDRQPGESTRDLAGRVIDAVNSLVPDGQDPEAGALRDAAQAVVDEAEPDDDWEGQYAQYLVPLAEFDALRAALAASPAPLDVERDDEGTVVETLDWIAGWAEEAVKHNVRMASPLWGFDEIARRARAAIAREYEYDAAKGDGA